MWAGHLLDDKWNQMLLIRKTGRFEKRWCNQLARPWGLVGLIFSPAKPLVSQPSSVFLMGSHALGVFPFLHKTCSAAAVISRTTFTSFVKWSCFSDSLVANVAEGNNQCFIMQAVEPVCHWVWYSLQLVVRLSIFVCLIIVSVQIQVWPSWEKWKTPWAQWGHVMLSYSPYQFLRYICIISYVLSFCIKSVKW